MDAAIPLPSCFWQAVSVKYPAFVLLSGLFAGLLLTGMAVQRSQKRLLQMQQYQQNQKFRSLFVQIPDTVYSFDLNGCFTEVNAVTTALTGIEANALIGQSYAPFIAHEYLEDSRKRFAQAASGTPTYGKLAIIDAVGKRIEISTINLPIVVEGQVIGVFGMDKDITARKSAENQNR